MASTYLRRTCTGGNQKIATFSAWVKKTQLNTENCMFLQRADGSNFFRIRFNGDQINFNSRVSGSDVYGTTTAVYRDVSGFYHIVLTVDTTQATASDRFKLYINNTQQTFSASSYPSQNADLQMNVNSMQNDIGGENGANYFDGLMSHVHWIDGTAYAPTDFGETDATTGIWKPKTAPSVTYGTNGFFLKFENSGSMGTDSSPNGNDFTVNGTLTQTLDSPSNVYCTMNPLSTSSTLTFANGNLNVTSGGGDVWRATAGTLGFQKGKWYWEAKILTDAGNNRGYYVGIAPSNVYLPSSNPHDQTTYTAYYTEAGGEVMQEGTLTPNLDLGTFANGDIIGVAVNYDSNQISFYKNGTALANNYTISSSLSGDWIPYLAFNSGTIGFNFGNGYFGVTPVSSATSDESGLGIFEYTVPSGYYALCTKNINTYG